METEDTLGLGIFKNQDEQDSGLSVGSEGQMLGARGHSWVHRVSAGSSGLHCLATF